MVKIKGELEDIKQEKDDIESELKARTEEIY